MHYLHYFFGCYCGAKVALFHSMREQILDFYKVVKKEEEK